MRDSSATGTSPTTTATTPRSARSGNRWLEVLWHCLTRGVRYDEAVRTANRNNALARVRAA